MKVICDRAALVEALNVVTAAVALRTPKPVLTCIKLTARDGNLTLAATDLEAALQLSTEKVDISTEGEALIPADKFSQICRESVDPTLTIDVKEDAASIRGQDSRFKVFGYPVADFPPLPDAADLGKPDFTIDAGQLTTLVERTRFATARENSRYAINGVLMKRKAKKIEFVATDGRRLAVARGTAASAGEKGESQCIIPGKALNHLLKLTGSAEDNVAVYITDSQVIFIVGQDGREAMLATNLVEGAFPPYEDVIPKDLDKKVTFELETLASAVRRAALLTNEESKGVRLSFKGGALTISSRAPEMGEAEIKVGLSKYEGDDVEVGFNPSFITDALKVVHSDQIVFELKGPTKPGMIRAGSDFTYVLMPVSLN